MQKTLDVLFFLPSHLKKEGESLILFKSRTHFILRSGQISVAEPANIQHYVHPKSTKADKIITH